MRTTFLRCRFLFANMPPLDAELCRLLHKLWLCGQSVLLVQVCDGGPRILTVDFVSETTALLDSHDCGPKAVAGVVERLGGREMTEADLRRWPVLHSLLVSADEAGAN